MPRVGIWAKSHQWNTLVKDDFLVISRLPLGSINLDVCEPWTLTRSEIFPLLDCICFSPKTGKLLLWCILTCHYKCDGVWIHQKGKIELLFAISGAKVPVTSSWREVANHGCCLSHNVKVCDVSYLYFLVRITGCQLLTSALSTGLSILITLLVYLFTFVMSHDGTSIQFTSRIWMTAST